MTYVLTLNLRRRHLPAERRREGTAKGLKADPKQSNRRVAEQVKVDHKALAARLKAMLVDATLKQSARDVSARLRATADVPTACTLLEELPGKDAPG